MVMASTTLEKAAILLLAVLLPIHILSVSLRLLRGNYRGGRSVSIRSFLLLGSVAVLLSAFYGLSIPEPSPRNDDAVVSELKDLNQKTAQLESILENYTKTLDSKILYLEQKDKLIKEMEDEIQDLQNALDNIKKSRSDSLYSEDRIQAMEEEVRLLWAELKNNNVDILVLESLAGDAEKKMEGVASEVEKIQSIVSEQWIQIRQLEQAFQLAKIMTAKVWKRSSSKDQYTTKYPNKCIVMQFVERIRHRYFPEVGSLPDSFFLGGSSLKSCISQAHRLLKGIVSVAQRYQLEFEDKVRQVMETNELTASLANEVVVFFLANAIITSLVTGAWVLCSSCISQSKG